MRKILYMLCGFICFNTMYAQQSFTDSGTYLLHKFEQHIGKETYTVVNANGKMNYRMNFNYVDRGSPVLLKANMQLTPKSQPISFNIKGGTSRFSIVDDSVVIKGSTAYIKVGNAVFNMTTNKFNSLRSLSRSL